MTEAARLPDAATEHAYDAVAGDEAALRPGVDALCTSLGLDPRPVQRFATGSLPVYAVGDVVLKLFPPVHVEELPVEAGVLTAVAGRLPVATPAVHATGVQDGWGYVVMDRLPGVDLAQVWPELDREARGGLAAQAGAVTAALHRVPPPAIEGWWPTSWPGFVAEQRETTVTRQQARGLDPQWLAQVPGFLASTPLSDGPEVLLHTEVMPANLRAALTAFGYRPDELDHDLSLRLMAWTLLHCYGAAYLQRLPAPDSPTLDALARRWFSAA